MRTALLSAMLFLAAFCRARPAPLQAEKKTVLPVKRYSLEAGLIQSMPHFARTDEWNRNDAAAWPRAFGKHAFLTPMG